MDADAVPDPRGAGPGGARGSPAEPGADLPGEDPEDPTDVPHEPLPFDRWRKRSAAGAALSGIALGLQEVFQPKRELPAFVMEAPGEPEDPEARITLRFDPDDPAKTVAVVRTPPPDGTPEGPPPHGA